MIRNNKDGTYEEIINRFDGGVVNDSRNTAENTAQAVFNFDIVTNPHKMTQYRDTTTADSAPTTSKKQNFAVASPDVSQTPFQLYALGVKSGTDTAEVLTKNISMGTASTNEFDDTSWLGTGAVYQSAAGTASMDCFVYYRSSATVGRIYLIERSSGTGAFDRIGSFDPQGTAWQTGAGGAGEGGASLAVTTTHVAQGLVHSKDDILYIPYENYIASKNGVAAFANSALILPRDVYITSICEYGNFIAIACAPRDGVRNSRVYLWDRDSSLTTLAETIDWGSGILKVLHEVDGVLIGISLQKDGVNTTPGTLVSFDERVIVRYLNGNKSEKYMELKAENALTQVQIAKQKIDNRLYFFMNIMLHGSIRTGIWSIGRSTPGAPFALIQERLPNGTITTGTETLRNFIVVGNFYFLSYDESGTFSLRKTNSTASYTINSIYESKIFDGGDASLTKKLIGVTAMFEYLPTGGEVLMKYRKDNETSFTTIFDTTTVGSISHSALNIETTGVTLPEFKEITLRLEAVGAGSPTEITGFSYKGQFVDKKLY